MTVKEAIWVLKSTSVNLGRRGGKIAYVEALEMAIEALKAQEKTDLISRKAAITAIQKAYADTESGEDKHAVWKNVGLTNALHIMQDLPSAQPEIIACGDCKHWICHDRRCGYWNHGVKPLDWCCHAERRNDE